MTQYVDSEYRQVDGPNVQKWGVGIPLTSMRTLVANDIPAQAGTPVAGVMCKDSLPILEATNGDTDTALRLNYAADEVGEVTFQVPLPPWLDPSEDMTIRIHAALGGTTDSLVIASDTFFDSADTKVEDNSGTVTGTVPADYTITIGNADIPIGARTASFSLTPGAHANDTLLLYSCWVEGKVI